MSYLDSFRKRMQVEGNSISNAFENSTAQAIAPTFKDSPFYKNVKVNGIDTDVRELKGKDSHTKVLTFLPYTVVDRGSLVEIGTKQWLVLDFDTNGLYPKAPIVLCNDTLKWKDANGLVKQHVCAVSNKDPATLQLEQDRAMSLQSGEFRILVQLTADTKEISINHRFVFGNNVYQVIGIDDFTNVTDGIGLLTIVVNATTKKTSDDITNKLADNSALYRSGTSGTNGISSTGGGVKW